MALDPQVQAMRARRIANGTPPLYALSIGQARAADLAAIRATGGSPEPVATVEDQTIPGTDCPLPIRVYRPKPGTRPHPVLVYFFGGGWVLGTIDTADAICRRLTNLVPCVVVAVGYRLAPEHKFPAAVDDCYAAVRWVADKASALGGDPARLAVGGDSAGGNLAAAVTLLARDTGPALVAQLLVYPNTDRFSDTPSIRENTDPALFNNRSVDWYWEHYLDRPSDGMHPLASPLRATDLSGLPPALILTAEYDPLRDQGEQYAERLQSSGVEVVATRYDGMVHGFFAMGGVLDAGRRAVEQAARFLAERLASPEPAASAHPPTER